MTPALCNNVRYTLAILRPLYYAIREVIGFEINKTPDIKYLITTMMAKIIFSNTSREKNIRLN